MAVATNGFYDFDVDEVSPPMAPLPPPDLTNLAAQVALKRFLREPW